MSLIEILKSLDKIIFILIQNDSDRFFLDNIMVGLRNPITWIPLYLYMLYFITKKKRNGSWLFILFSILTVAIADNVSASLLKPYFARLRPCADPEIYQYVRNLVDCGGLYSFPSSHAANHFGLATFWFWSIFKITGKKWQWLWVWALLIGYAQIYVGKHYPFDIAAGALLGWCIGLIMAKTFEIFSNGNFLQQRILLPV